MERDEVVEYKEREESDDEYDEASKNVKGRLKESLCFRGIIQQNPRLSGQLGTWLFHNFEIVCNLEIMIYLIRSNELFIVYFLHQSSIVTSKKW